MRKWWHTNDWFSNYILNSEIKIYRDLQNKIYSKELQGNFICLGYHNIFLEEAFKIIIFILNILSCPNFIVEVFLLFVKQINLFNVWKCLLNFNPFDQILSWISSFKKSSTRNVLLYTILFNATVIINITVFFLKLKF